MRVLTALSGSRARDDDVGALFLAFLIYATMLWSGCEPAYVYDTQTRLRGKLQWLSRELVIDAEMKVKAVQHYRDQYYKSLQYQLGDTVYEMRDIYKKVIRVYQAVDKNISYGYLDGVENVKELVRVHQMCAEVENKVIMLQTWQRKRESKEERHERMLAARRGARDVPAGAAAPPPPRAPPRRQEEEHEVAPRS